MENSRSAEEDRRWRLLPRLLVLELKLRRRLTEVVDDANGSRLGFAEPTNRVTGVVVVRGAGTLERAFVGVASRRRPWLGTRSTLDLLVGGSAADEAAAPSAGSRALEDESMPEAARRCGPGEIWRR